MIDTFDGTRLNSLAFSSLTGAEILNQRDSSEEEIKCDFYWNKFNICKTYFNRLNSWFSVSPNVKMFNNLDMYYKKLTSNDTLN